MTGWWQRIRREWQDYRAFCRIPVEDRRIVIYSEGRGFWTHFEPVFQALRDEHAESVLYVTSDRYDPLLELPPEGMQSFCIGEHSIRTLFFAGLQAKVLLMTLPDLHSYQLKRSPHGVHYVYLHHSIVSSHMIYRPAAFDHFDALLCVGPHHLAETRAREQHLDLADKTLVEHGYGRLDAILAEGNAGPLAREDAAAPQVLVAPSWGEQALLERHGADVLRPLLEAGLRVVLRPHPRTRKLRSGLLEAIAAEFRDHPDFHLDEDTDGKDSLLTSDLMVSDWSGAALEFALGLERPVLFVDVPRKVWNPDYQSLGIEPLEVQIREQVGRVLDPQDLESLGDTAREMLASPQQWQHNIRAARERWIFNVGHSGSVAARYLVGQLD